MGSPRFSRVEIPRIPRAFDCAAFFGRSHQRFRRHGLPSRWTTSALRCCLFRGSNTPARTFVNASRSALRLTAHDSGAGWRATPFLCDSFITTPRWPINSDAPTVHLVPWPRLVFPTFAPFSLVRNRRPGTIRSTSTAGSRPTARERAPDVQPDAPLVPVPQRRPTREGCGLLRQSCRRRR